MTIMNNEDPADPSVHEQRVLDAAQEARLDDPAYAEGRKDEREATLAEFAALLPGPYYMDPPDGGSVTVLEQFRRMALDAQRWRAQQDSLSKALESSGRIYSEDHPDAYATVLDAMNVLRSPTRSEALAAAGFTRRPSLKAMEMRAALELIATPQRPDGTWNRDREACRELAAEALGRYDDSKTPNVI